MTIPLRPEHGDRTMPISGADPRLTLRRTLVGYAYAANGNVHNPTPRYHWLLQVDGRTVDHAERKRDLINAARTNAAAYLDNVASL